MYFLELRKNSIDKEISTFSVNSRVDHFVTTRTKI